MPTHKKPTALTTPRLIKQPLMPLVWGSAALALIALGAVVWRFLPFDQGSFWGVKERIAYSHAQTQEQTVVLQNGVTIQNIPYTGTEDASIGTRTSHSGSLSLENYYYSQRGLLRFNLNSIPPGEIRSATLSVYIQSYSGLYNDLKNQGKIDLGIHKVTQASWDDNTANWNTYDGTNNWTNPGGDFNPTPVSTFTIDTVDSFQNTWISFDVTALIQEYINNGTEPNPGMLLKASSRVYPILTFVSSESSDLTLRPKLEITYFSEAPLADAGVNQGVSLGEVVTLDATNTVDSQEPAKNLIYQWHFVSKSSASNLTDDDIIPNNTTGINGADKPTFTVDAEGDYKIELTATNSLGLSDKEWVAITSLNINKHPRIWMTPEKLQTLRDRAAADTPQWVAFKEVVDRYLANDSNPYNEVEYIYTYALAYQITGDERYAARALNIMDEIVYPFDLPKGQSGYLGSYFARSYPVYLAVGYDWLYNYLSQEDKIRFYEKMNEWADFYFYDPSYAGSWGVNEPNNNFFYGRIVGGGLTGLATFGDNPRAPEWFDLVRNDKYENLSKPKLVTHYKNGGWLYEGSGYSVASYEFLFQYFLALKTATGENLFGDTNFGEAVVYNIIYNTQPTLDRYLITGDGYSPEEWPDGWLDDYIRILMLILAEEFRGPASSEYARWYLKHNQSPKQMRQDYRKWKDIFWDDAGASERDIADLPLSYFDGDGTGYIYARSDWSRDATWLAFQSGGDDVIYDHEHYDQVSFYIFKKTWLAAPGGLYGSGATANYNTIIVNDGSKDYGQVARKSGPSVIERYEASGDYVYTLGQGKGNYPALLDNYARQIIFLRPDYVIVFDRIRTAKQNYYPKWLLHSVNEPSVAGNLTTIINGAGKMFVKTLLPSDVTSNKVSGVGWSIHLTDNQLPKQDYLFLNILQTADTSQQAMVPTEQISADSGNMEGAKLELSADDLRVVMFSKTDQNQTGVIYTLPQTTALVKHLIADLEPSYQYNIYKDGELLETKGSSSEGTLYFVSKGASRFEITQGAPTPQPKTPTLTLTKSVDKTTVEDGDVITYTLAYQNTGAGEARNITITDTIPQGTSYIQGSATNGGAFDGTKVTWTISTLLPNAQGTVSFQVTVGGATTPPPPPPTQASLLFKSGFESQVNLIAPLGNGGQWWQNIAGKDLATGYTWPSDLPGAASSQFQYLVGDANPIASYIETRLDTVTGPQGTQTTALYQEVKQDDTTYTATSRNQFNLYPNDQGSLEEAYAKYWIKFQPDLDAIMGNNTWRNIMEWRETGDDYRWAIYVIRPSTGGTLRWKVEGELGVGGGPIDWSIQNTTTLVPTGKWFQLEVYWKRDTGANGKVLVQIDGQTIADYTGRNKIDSNLNVWNMFKVYTDKSVFSNGPAYQWIDDVEIWDGKP